MIAALVLESVALVFVAVVLYQEMGDSRKQRRGYINRENDLLNRLAHMSGNAWMPPPAEESETVVSVPEYLPLPEQEEE